MQAAWLDEDGAWRTTQRGRQVLSDPRINKGTAFTETERRDLQLTGLIPAGHMQLDEQVARVHAQYLRQPTALARNILLTEVRDRNEVLFYRLLIANLAEMLPVVYTPAVGQAIESYSHEYRRPRGAYLSVDHPELIETSLRAAGLASDDVDLIVATDGEAILGIGDWGVGGIHIAVAKGVVYTAAGGIDPDRVLPVVLDVGTDRQSLLDDPLYIGNRHPRARAAEYDSFIDLFVKAAGALFPRALLHWEDLGAGNARRILERYQDRLLTFNDDIQGTGAVNLAAVLAAVRVTGLPLSAHRIVIFGAGTAGIGIADQLAAQMRAEGLSPGQAADRFWAVDQAGLITGPAGPASGAGGAAGAAARYARDPGEVADWPRGRRAGGPALAEVVRRARPTILIGTSTKGGAFTEDIVRQMAEQVPRPVIMPMSNPTELSEADPADIIRWTEGRALVATGSPFGPADYDGVRYEFGQANNALIFPGLGLGVIGCQARRVTGGMLAAAARAVAGLAGPAAAGAPLLPPMAELRETSAAVAAAVMAAAAADGVAGRLPPGDLREYARDRMWQPVYRPVRPA